MAVTSWIRRMFNNGVITTAQLASGINAGATTYSVGAGQGSTFPDGSVGPFITTIGQGLGNEERVLNASRTGDVFTVAASGRGYNGYTAQSHNAQESVLHTMDKQDLDEANQVANQTLGQIAAAGDLLYGSAANTLAKLGIGTSGRVLESSGTVPQWVNPNTLGLQASQIEALFTANNQIFIGTGSGAGQLRSLLTAVENQFTADGQIISGTGTASGELIDLLVALKEYYVTTGDLLIGTGAGNAEFLGIGPTGTALRVGGADPSGLQWAAAPTAAGVLGADYTATGSLVTFLTTASLGIGTWKVTFKGLATLAGAGFAKVIVAAGTATATFGGPIADEVNNNAGGSGDFGLTFTCIATVTVAGTLVFQAKGTGTSVIKQLDPDAATYAVTGYVAEQA